MPRYRVFAMFDYPPIDRSAVVETYSPELAMIKAVVERKVPVQFRHDANRNLQPVYWQPAMGGDTPWPKVIKPKCLQWNDASEKKILRFDIELLND